MNFLKVKNLILEILFPPICLSCKKFIGDEKNLLCQECFDSVKINNTLFCPVCQARIPGSKAICSHSKEKSGEFPFLLASATSYSNTAIKDLIHNFKYKKLEKLSLIIEKILSDYLDSLDFKFNNFYIAAMPLHPFKEIKRGFNQSEIIAQIAAKKLNLEIIKPLVRIKNTKPQAKAKNQKTRRENVLNAFVLNPSENIHDKNIVIIDDIYTTGATMSEAAKVLKQGGVKKIIALVVAKV